MPVPKGKEDLYGKIAGHMQNLGKSLGEAKNIADRAVKVKKNKKVNKKSKFIFIFLLLLPVCIEAKCVEVKRNLTITHRFEKLTGYPHGRKGYVVDHINPLCAGGLDSVENMQWQTLKDSYLKDIQERKYCKSLWEHK